MKGLPKELPEGSKRPLQKALNILVSKGVVSDEESADIQEINEIRNTIGHSIHNLVNDITYPDTRLMECKEYDYHALTRLEAYREKIEKGLQKSYVMLLSFDGVAFEQAALTYKEELSRLKKKIDRQYIERFSQNA